MDLKVDQGLKKALLFIVITIAMALVLSGCRTPQQASAPRSQTMETTGEVVHLSLEEAKVAYDSDTALFLDVRSSGSYASSHIPGATSLPLAELESRMGELDPNQWIITYCT